MSIPLAPPSIWGVLVCVCVYGYYVNTWICASSFGLAPKSRTRITNPIALEAIKIVIIYWILDRITFSIGCTEIFTPYSQCQFDTLCRYFRIGHRLKNTHMHSLVGEWGRGDGNEWETNCNALNGTIPDREVKRESEREYLLGIEKQSIIGFFAIFYLGRAWIVAAGKVHFSNENNNWTG